MTKHHLPSAQAAQDSTMAEFARIRDQAVQIAQGREHLGAQIPLPQNQELRELTVAFNTLSAALHRNQVEQEQHIRDLTLALQGTDQELLREITECRRAEKDLEVALRDRTVLLQEIHHRVKNNLQVISSLLDMQSLISQDPEIERILQDSRNRVKAVALIHEALYQSADLANIHLENYVQDLTGHLLHVYGSQAPGVIIHTQVDPVALSIDIAIPCGLLLNELVSNALKHAFPVQSEAPGRIWVKFRSQPEGQFTLIVGDNGVGLPPDSLSEDVSSLGLQLVAMLTQQLNGTLEIDRGVGTRFTISFPAHSQAGRNGEAA
jgi:two-component sensor histidine kinase